MAALGDDRISTDEQLVRASTKGELVYEAVETLLKGSETSLIEHGHPALSRQGRALPGERPAAVVERNRDYAGRPR